jgi:hypothetical protein
MRRRDTAVWTILDPRHRSVVTEEQLIRGAGRHLEAIPRFGIARSVSYDRRAGHTAANLPRVRPPAVATDL